MPSQQLKGKSLSQQKVAAYLMLVQESESFWRALLVFLGALFMLGSFPFYPLPVIPIIALICAFIAYGSPWLGTFISILFAFPAITYQSAIFGWLFLLVIAFSLVELIDSFKDPNNDKWAIISALEILIFAPFAFGTLPFFGWITILGMVIASLHFGSKKSIMVSIPAVFAILLLSSLWLAENNAYMPLKLEKYLPGASSLMITKPAADMFELPSTFGASLSSLFDTTQVLPGVPEAMARVWNNSITILIGDSGVLQLLVWAVVLFGVSRASGYSKGKHVGLVSSFLLIFIIPSYYAIAYLFEVAFHTELIFAIFSSVAVIGILEHFGISISRETEARHIEKMKAFGKFGLQDMSIAPSGEKSLADIGDYDDVKQELRDSIIMPLEKKEVAYAYDIKPPSGILLFGPPGTGKTMIMRALAKELKYHFVEVKASELLSMWYGESEKNVAEIFADARKIAPTIIFFDEIDAIGKKRTQYGQDDVGPRILSILLQEMDGTVKGKRHVLVIGATNVPHQLDPALLRPGRFDKIIYMRLPDKEGRMKIFEVHLSKLSKKGALDEYVDLEKLAIKTERFSGADIKNIVDEATRLAAKEASKSGEIVPISMNHLLQVLKKIRPSTGIAQLEDYERFKMDFERSVSGKEEVKEREEAVKWEDVAGLDKVKQALLETIELPLLREDLMKEFKVKPSKGILLFGPPGTGKTLIVKAASNELKASFQTLSGAEIMKLGYTQAVTVIRETFNRARENAPSIIFIDEIETFAPARSTMGVSSEIVGQLLSEMDGLKELKGVVVMAATNKPSMLDSAILRPGRFDKMFYIPPPDRKGRGEIFRIHLGKFAEELELGECATQTEGFSGADIAGVCQEAKMEAVRAKLQGKEAKITSEMLLKIIANRRPSITKEMLWEYEKFKEEYGERG